MINTIKNFKWFFGVSFLCVLLGVFTFITFINQNFIFLNENKIYFALKPADKAVIDSPQFGPQNRNQPIPEENKLFQLK